LEQSTSNSTPASENQRKKFEMISPDVRALIVDKVLYTGEMTWENAMVAYKVSRSSIALIFAEEKKSKNGTPKPPPRKHGRHSPFPVDIALQVHSNEH